MSDDELEQGPEEEFERLLRELLSGGGAIDPAQLAKAAGLPNDPASVAALISQLQQAINTSGDGINWSVATTQGEARASSSEQIGRAHV